MKKLIPAPIDEKNVTTDWIEEIFDNGDCARYLNRRTGFVFGSVCSCIYKGNHILWQINKEYADDAVKSYDQLIKRLKEHDTPPLVVLYDTSKREELFLLQTFHWEDE